MSYKAIAQYLTTLTARRLSAATRREVRSDLSHCRWWETKHALLFDVTAIVDRDTRECKQARQVADCAAPATTNRGPPHCAVFVCAVSKSPTTGIEDVPYEILSPCSLPDQAVDTHLLAVRSEPDFRLRLCDEAILDLLIYAGLQVQEVCKVQLRDVEVTGG